MNANSPVAALRSAWHASIMAPNPPSAIGIDLVEVEPLRQLLEAGGSRFVEAAWTSRELREANGQPEALAGKWAAKEAVMKALRRGIGDIDPLDIEIVTRPSGAPIIALHRSAKSVAKARRIDCWCVSVTHDGGWAAAIALGSQARHRTHPDPERRTLG